MTVGTQAAEWGSKPSERRECIARAGRACVARKGPHKVTVTDVTREAGITRELFYYYYHDRSDILSAVLDTYLADVRKLLSEALAPLFEAQRGTAWGARFDALVAVMGALRSWTELDQDAACPMKAVFGELDLWPAMVHRASGIAVTMLGEAGFVSNVGMEEGAAGLGRVIALVGAVDFMLCRPDIGDDELAIGIMPVFS